MPMGRPSQTKIWPFVVVVSLLFLLCLTAPWEREWLNFRRGSHALRGTQSASLDARREAPEDLVSDEASVDEVPEEGEADEACQEPATADETPMADRGADPAPVASSIKIDTATPHSESNTSTLTLVSPRTSESNASADTAGRTPKTNNEAEGGPVEPRATRAASSATATPSASEQRQPASESSNKPAAPARLPVESGWPMPEELLRRLDGLACECPCSAWAIRANSLINELIENTTPGDDRSLTLIAELRMLAAEVDPLLPTVEQRDVSIELLRVRHALLRRLDIWALTPELTLLEDQEFVPSKMEISRLAKAIGGVESLTRLAGAEGVQWHEYLALDDLRKITADTTGANVEESRRVAGQVLERIGRANLTAGQRKFVTDGPVSQLARALRPWVRNPFDPVRLLADIERFESTMQTSDARLVAEQTADVDETLRGLSERLELNYRNANIRAVITDKLIRRMLPAVETRTETVRDQVLGLPTRGASTTETKVDVKLVPNKKRLTFALEATGRIFANTESSATAVTLHTRSDSMFMARKLLDFDVHGVRAWPAESDCLSANTSLRGIDTDLDSVPVARELLQSFARSKHAESQAEVRNLLRYKVETQARQKMDDVTDERVAMLNQQLQDRLMTPLAGLGLDPQVISADTTAERLTLRMRLASDDQLAGHTPRPRAPGDSLASFQIHQSVLNNCSEQLGLNGRTFTLTELRDHIIAKLNLKNSPFMNSVDKDVSVTFAKEDAILVRCEDGRLELTLSVAKLWNSDNSWKNFGVRVYYRPVVSGLTARLVRDGTVQLVGPRLNTRSQIALRGIFSKAFARDREMTLVPTKWSTDERTKDLFFSQFVIQDGWIAAAVSEPKTNVARRPATSR